MGHPTRFLKTSSMDRLQLKANRKPGKNGISSVSAATAAAICAVAADVAIHIDERSNIVVVSWYFFFH